MIQPTWFDIAKDLGLGIFLSVGVFGLCVWMVKFIITKLDKQMDRHATALDKLELRIEKSENRQAEAHRYQREEHRQMIDQLIKLNGNVSERRVV